MKLEDEAKQFLRDKVTSPDELRQELIELLKQFIEELEKKGL